MLETSPATPLTELLQLQGQNPNDMGSGSGEGFVGLGQVQVLQAQLAPGIKTTSCGIQTVSQSLVLSPRLSFAPPPPPPSWFHNQAVSVHVEEDLCVP